MEQPVENSTNQYADDNHSTPSPADSYQYNSSNSSLSIQNLNSPTDGSNGTNSNDTSNYANLANYYNGKTIKIIYYYFRLVNK
jgi:hypothetical protein